MSSTTRMNRRRALAATATMAVLGAGLAAGAQEPDAPPSYAGQVDTVFARWDTTNGPGCAVAVTQDGQTVHARGYGMANLDYDVPIRADTVFHVASVSKQFTAAALALLVLEGAVSLDEPIQTYLSWVPDFGETVTVRHLVHHTSGIRDQWSLLGMAGWRYARDRITNDDVTDLIRRQRDLNFSPGERYLYSNTGYTLMGQIVEAVTGRSLRAFTTERIFEPLGMTRTHFRDDFTEIVKGQATGYRWDDGTTAFHASVTNFDTVGATSLLTTVEDLVRWDRHFLDPVLGGSAFLDLMHAPGRLNDGTEQDYAFGLTIGTYRGLRTVEHGGADAGYRAHFLRFPDDGLSVAVLCNVATATPSRRARDVADIYLEPALEPMPEARALVPPAVPLDDDARRRIEGTYWADGPGALLEIDTEPGALRFRLGGRPVEMTHAGDGRFRVAELEAEVRFEPASGPAERVRFWRDGQEDRPQLAQRLTRDGTAVPAAVVGRYASPELPVVHTIEERAGRLVIHWLKRAPAELWWGADDLLVGPGVGSLRLQRDERGAVTGFRLDAGRVRNVRFDRLPSSDGWDPTGEPQ